MIGRRAALAAMAAAGIGGLARAKPRAPAAAADLTGTWTNATYTDLQRPKELPRLVLTAAEAEAWEKPRRALNGMPASKEGTVGQAESEFNDRGSGMLRVGGEIRASIIVDPADGQVPYLPAIRARLELDVPPEKKHEPLDNVEERPLEERCLIAANTTAPLVPGPDTNIFQFVQTPDAFVIVAEKYHDARIVRFGADATAEPGPLWLGRSAGRWEGPRLVVETTGFGPGLLRRRPAVSECTRVVETFERTAPDEIRYGFTVEDPSVYSQRWRGEYVFRAAPGRQFEYACHEGNYGLPDILRAARRAEGK